MPISSLLVKSGVMSLGHMLIRRTLILDNPNYQLEPLSAHEFCEILHSMYFCVTVTSAKYSTQSDSRCNWVGGKLTGERDEKLTRVLSLGGEWTLFALNAPIYGEWRGSYTSKLSVQIPTPVHFVTNMAFGFKAQQMYQETFWAVGFTTFPTVGPMYMSTQNPNVLRIVKFYARTVRIAHEIKIIRGVGWCRSGRNIRTPKARAYSACNVFGLCRWNH